MRMKLCDYVLRAEFECLYDLGDDEEIDDGVDYTARGKDPEKCDHYYSREAEKSSRRILKL